MNQHKPVNPLTENFEMETSWQRQSQDLYSLELCCVNLKQAVHARNLSARVKGQTYFPQSDVADCYMIWMQEPYWGSDFKPRGETGYSWGGCTVPAFSLPRKFFG